jgi:hypothetical protein
VSALLVEGDGDRLALPLHGVQSVAGALIIGSFAPDAYTEADLETGQRIAKLIGPLVENIVLLHKERHRQRRLAVLPEVAHVVGTSLNAGEIFAQLGAAVRTVLDFDMMIARLLGPSGALEGPVLWVSDRPEEPPCGDRPDDYSFGARILAGELAIIFETRTELDPGRRGDRLALARGVRSIMAVPLIFGERVEGVSNTRGCSSARHREGDGRAGNDPVRLHGRRAESMRRLCPRMLSSVRTSRLEDIP